MIHLSFYVPDSHLELVKKAIFEAGAGRIGNYQSCCWQVRGTGQFEPMAGADPHTGVIDELSQAEEWKVELVVADTEIVPVIEALKAAHPYEEPAYQAVQCLGV